MRLILLIVLALGSYYFYSNRQSETVSVVASSDVRTESVKTRKASNGVTYVTPQEMDYISKTVNEKYYNRDYTDFTLPDGTYIDLNFQHTGKICPRTKRPIMTISISQIAVLK